jgi:hypothetical protein
MHCTQITPATSIVTKSGTPIFGNISRRPWFVWGERDFVFGVPGAEGYRLDLKQIEVHILKAETLYWKRTDRKSPGTYQAFLPGTNHTPNAAGRRSMIIEPAQFRCLTIAVAALVAAFCTPAQAEKPIAEFKAENIAAMNKMMAGMAIKSSNDVDRDFASMMIPHHQGAIEMAEAELRHGHNEQLRRIAQEIIVDQQQEIAAMRLALGDQP